MQHLFDSFISNLLAIEKNYVLKLEIIQTKSFLLISIISKRMHYAVMVFQIPNEALTVQCPLILFH